MRSQIEHRFKYHPPIEKLHQASRYQAIRKKCGEVALFVFDETPPSREQSLAITHLEEAVYWANAAIARHEIETDTPDM